MVTLRKGEEIEATATFAAAPDKKFPLTLKEFSTEADPQTQTYQVVMVMDRPEGINILPGMTATVTGRQLSTADSTARIVIPAIAVLEDPQEKAFVWVLKQEDMTVQKTVVTVGEMTGSDSILVIDGLKGGEQIVTSGVTKLQDGMEVSIWKE